ncbi:hypothetical protein DSO57_1026538 [Entomophthora muscae]|uniref:Uncharacterized protein n=1 Tax=Entomophthora muscae TaxID=34485 RepID=A0ACC2T241_9FUNG|nr:hypothetical protein DSO57_1026538 [Entomophthora muscae]
MHVPGKQNMVANRLSRQFSLLTEMADYQANLQKFVDVTTRKVHPKSREDISEFIANSLKFTLVNRKLFRKMDDGLRVVSAKGTQAAILVEVHEENGHFGQHATVEKIKAMYWWPKMYSEAIEHIEKCQPCQRFSKKIEHTKLIIPIVAEKMFTYGALNS